VCSYLDVGSEGADVVDREPDAARRLADHRTLLERVVDARDAAISIHITWIFEYLQSVFHISELPGEVQ
jgi:hypothetical protein